MYPHFNVSIFVHAAAAAAELIFLNTILLMRC